MSIDIKELAIKHGGSDSPINELFPDKTRHFITLQVHQLQAFADDYLALSSSEPTYQIFLTVDDWSDCSKKDYDSHDVSAKRIVYLANPINLEMVEAIKQLEEKFRDILSANSKLEAENVASEALASISPTIQKLLSEVK